MATKDEKLTIEMMQAKLNTRYKEMEEKREKEAKEEKALFKIHQKAEENVMAALNNKQFKGTCRSSGKYEHSVANCLDNKNSVERNSDARSNNSSNTQCRFAGKYIYCGKDRI